jgi:hypothetical protein
MSRWIGLTASIVFTGCISVALEKGGGKIDDVHADMLASKAAYQQCLKQNAAEPAKCEGLRLAFEADVAAYRAVTGAPAPVGAGP